MLVAQLCLTLCDPMDCSPPGSSVHGDSPGMNAGVGCHGLLQGIFPTYVSKPRLSCCRWILYYLSHQGSPRILAWVAYPFSRGIFPTQDSNWGLLHCRWILDQLNHLGACYPSYSFVFPLGWAGSPLPCAGSLFRSMGSVDAVAGGCLAASQRVGS